MAGQSNQVKDKESMTIEYLIGNKELCIVEAYYKISDEYKWSLYTHPSYIISSP